MSYALFFTLTGKTCATIYPRPHSKFNNLKLSGKKTAQAEMAVHMLNRVEDNVKFSGV